LLLVLSLTPVIAGLEYILKGLVDQNEYALSVSVLLMVPSFIAMWLFHAAMIDTTETLRLLWREYRAAAQDKKKLTYD